MLYDFNIIVLNNCIKSIKDFIDIKSISQLKSYK